MTQNSGSRAGNFDCVDEMKQGGGTAKLSIRPACQFGPANQRWRPGPAKGRNIDWQTENTTGPPECKGGKNL